jgi:electron transport complex protein RnfD
MSDSLLVSPAPHIKLFQKTSTIMWFVSLALAPAGIWGIHIFGLNALIVLAVSIGSALATEGVINIFIRKNTLLDGSAFLTGLLVGYNMPPNTALFVPAVASFFAIVVVKWSFGGLGANWMNPALAGRAFVFFSWTKEMTSWALPLPQGQRFFTRLFMGRFDALASASADALSTASPLSVVKTGLSTGVSDLSGPLQLLMANGSPYTYSDMFFGRIPGCIGEGSVLLLGIGFLFLLVFRIVRVSVPIAYLGSFSLLVWIFGGLPFGHGFFTGDILFHLLTGGLVLGALFMATDMVTSPLTTTGRIIFGIGCGVLTFLIRIYGSLPEGVSLAIIFMNILVPLIDRFTKPSKFGYGRIKDMKA